MAPIHGLILDACNILYDDTAWRRWLLRLLVRLGLRTSYHSFFRVLDRDYLGDVYRGHRDFDDALGDFLRAAGLSAGQTEEVRTACQSYRRKTENNLRPLTSIPGTLRQLHASGVALGVLCNCDQPGDVLARKLDRLLAASPWTAVVSSRDLGRAMPDPACYQRALEALDLPPENVAFVSHDALELAGASVCGLWTVAFNYDSDARADRYLQRFEDLLDLVHLSLACTAAA